jgi:secreted trypsin-like serine protease
MTRISRLALPLLAALGACADPSTPAGPAGGTAAIQGGAPTGPNQFQSVGALLFDFDQNGIWDGNDEVCSGTLISPTVFLTAAHCVSFLPPTATVAVSFNDDLYATPITAIVATEFHYNPLSGQSQANLNDHAVVLLPAGSTAGLTPYSLPPAGFLDQLAAQGGLNNALFFNVGYGVAATQKGRPGFSYDGKRSFSESPFMALQPGWLGLLMNRNVTGLGGDCYGDSGGPKFLESAPTMVLATVTTGDFNCRATTWAWRTDTPAARAFLGQYVTLP